MRGQAGGGAPPARDQALFCDFVAGIAIQAFEVRCEDAGGDTVTCLVATEAQSCSATLLEANIACPAAGAPAASAWGLGALAAVLSAGGILLLRRRRTATA
jgi:hypothetical protein